MTDQTKRPLTVRCYPDRVARVAPPRRLTPSQAVHMVAHLPAAPHGPVLTLPPPPASPPATPPRWWRRTALRWPAALRWRAARPDHIS